jgi:hypothetical protein
MPASKLALGDKSKGFHGSFPQSRAHINSDPPKGHLCQGDKLVSYNFCCGDAGFYSAKNASSAALVTQTTIRINKNVRNAQKEFNNSEYGILQSEWKEMPGTYAK